MARARIFRRISHPFQPQGKPMKKIVVVNAALVVLIPALVFVASREQATVDAAAGYGPKPRLPAPNPGLIPTVNIAPAIGWPEGVIPLAAQGLQANEFAAGFDHPRWLYVLPNGDVLVAESNAPPKPDASFSIKGWVMGLVMSRAGANIAENGIEAETNHAGILEIDLTTRQTHVFASGLRNPNGLAWQPDSGALWVAVNERDEIGSDLVPTT